MNLIKKKLDNKKKIRKTAIKNNYKFYNANIDSNAIEIKNFTRNDNLSDGTLRNNFITFLEINTDNLKEITKNLLNLKNILTDTNFMSNLKEGTLLSICKRWIYYYNITNDENIKILICFNMSNVIYYDDDHQCIDEIINSNFLYNLIEKIGQEDANIIFYKDFINILIQINTQEYTKKNINYIYFFNIFYHDINNIYTVFNQSKYFEKFIKNFLKLFYISMECEKQIFFKFNKLFKIIDNNKLVYFVLKNYNCEYDYKNDEYFFETLKIILTNPNFYFSNEIKDLNENLIFNNNLIIKEKFFMNFWKFFGEIEFYINDKVDLIYLISLNFFNSYFIVDNNSFNAIKNDIYFINYWDFIKNIIKINFNSLDDLLSQNNNKYYKNFFNLYYFSNKIEPIIVEILNNLIYNMNKLQYDIIIDFSKRIINDFNQHIDIKFNVYLNFFNNLYFFEKEKNLNNFTKIIKNINFNFNYSYEYLIQFEVYKFYLSNN